MFVRPPRPSSIHYFLHAASDKPSGWRARGVAHPPPHPRWQRGFTCPPGQDCELEGACARVRADVRTLRE